MLWRVQPVHLWFSLSAVSPVFSLPQPGTHPQDWMEAPGGAKAPGELKKGAQNLMKPSLSGEHNPAGGEERGFSVPIAGLLQVTERRQPLSSVSSLEVHFDLLDLTELTDMSDQELAEVFADSDEENHNQSPTSNHQPSLGQGGYMRSPSWTRCSKGDQSREQKQQSDSESAESFLPREKRKEP